MTETEVLTQETTDSRAEERYYFASQTKLIWWRFRQHRLAMVSGPILLLLYLIAAVCEIVAPYGPQEEFPEFLFAPPSRIRVRDTEGNLVRPFVYAREGGLNPETFRREYSEIEDVRYPILLFPQGSEYDFWGLFPMSRRLFGTGVDNPPVFLFGTD